MLFALGFINLFTLFGTTIFAGFGNGLTMPSSNAGSVSVRPQLAGSASGLSGAVNVAGGALLTFLTGLILTETNAAYALLLMMLACSIIGLAAALYVLKIDRQEGKISS